MGKNPGERISSVLYGRGDETDLELARIDVSNSALLGEDEEMRGLTSRSLSGSFKNGIVWGGAGMVFGFRDQKCPGLGTRHFSQCYL